ncbi:MAG: NAD(P)/FAD-dependent oxidoreductase [Longicatena sp.]
MYDCIIIGAGISGCSLAFELSKYQGRILLLDKENDVANGTTKANSAIIHAGYDPMPGTNMAKYNVEGNKIIPQICKDLDVPLKNIGSLVVAFDEKDREVLNEILARGIKNGVPDLRIVEEKELHEMEPNLNAHAIAALYAPSACIVNPWDLAIAYGETAVKNGVKFEANKEVISIKKDGQLFVVKTSNDVYKSKTVVNAAGVECDSIVKMLREPDYEIEPNKGEYYLLDKSQGTLVNHVIFQCPTKEGKGTLIAPTVHGNLIVGPSSIDCENGDLSTTLLGLNKVKQESMKSVPSINFRENIRTFAGIRARRKDKGDFVVGEDNLLSNFFHVAAMQSPGLSSASAIAVALVKDFQKKGLFIKIKSDAITTRKVVRFKEMSNEERIAYIKEHPAYGRIVCRCETISEGEILDAVHRVIPPVSIDGVKRRCNAGMGRCQGGFCGPRVQEILASELKLSQEEIVQDKTGSVILFGRTKEGKK